MTFDRRGVLLAGPFAALLAACRPAPVSAAPEGSLQRIADLGGVPALGGMVVTPEGLAFLDVAGVRVRGEMSPCHVLLVQLRKRFAPD